jgi:hypothetical protein
MVLIKEEERIADVPENDADDLRRGVNSINARQTARFVLIANKMYTAQFLER